MDILKQLRKEPELLMGVSAVFISLIAVAVALFQAQIAREQLKSSVWPYLEATTSNVEGLKLRVANKGVGPAKIQDVRIRLDGKPVPKLTEAIDAFNPDFGWNIVKSTLNHRVLAAGESIDYLQLDEAGKNELSKHTRFQLEVEICYCSVYGDCWVSRGLSAAATERCEADERLSFRH